MFDALDILVLLANLLVIYIVIVRPISVNNRKLSIWVLSVITVFYIALLIYNGFVSLVVTSMITGIVVFFALIKYLFKIKKIKNFEIISYVIAVIITAAYLIPAVFIANDLKVTNYSFDVGSKLKIVQISDIHYGSFAYPSKLNEIVTKANAENPDLIVLTGDIFDENTKEKSLYEACEILSTLDAKYGVYYVTGNHDWQVESKRLNEIFKILSEYNITPLRDSIASINDDYVLVGLDDPSLTYGLTVDDVLMQYSKEISGKKAIVLKHQPSDYVMISQTKCIDIDLVLSGHTHGGQMFPINVLYGLSSRHSDDLIYGTTNINGIDFVVSSGTTGGEMPFKNCTISEIVVVDLY